MRATFARRIFARAALAVCLSLLSLSPTIGPAHAQGNVSPALQQKSTQASALVARADSEGHVSVIVEFQLPADAPVLQPDASVIAAVRSALSTVQDRIIEDHFNDARNPREGAGFSRSLRKFEISPLIVLNADSRELNALAQDSRITGIFENGMRDPLLAQSVPLIGMNAAYSAGATGSNTAIAIIDTGVQSGHPALSGKVLLEQCFSNSAGAGVSLCPNGSTRQNGSGAASPASSGCQNGQNNLCYHGTSVAGIAAGLYTGSGEFPTRAGGVAKNAKIVAVQVFTRLNSGCPAAAGPPPCLTAYDADILAALDFVYQNTVLRDEGGNSYTFAAANLSLGSGGYSSACDGISSGPLFKSKFARLLNANIAPVVASGNDGFSGLISYPSCISNAIAVAASTKSDVLASYSNFSPQVALVAPGSNIYSPIVLDSTPTLDDWTSMSGTSMAAPHVAGAFAAIRSAKPQAKVSEILSALQSVGPAINGRRRIQVDQANAQIAGDVYYAVDVSANPPNSGGATGGGTRRAGETAVVEGFPNPGYKFKNWTESGAIVSTSYSYEFVVNRARTLVANFETDTSNYTIATSPFPSNGGTVSGGGVYSSGASVTINAVPAAGYVFYNWTENGVAACWIASCTFQATVNRQLVANFALASGPPNDSFANAIVISGNSGSTSGSNVGAAKESGEPDHGGNQGGASTWWKWTPASSGTVTFQTTGSSFNTLLGIYTGSSVGALFKVADNNDNPAGGVQSLVTFNAVAGMTYYIAVDGLWLFQPAAVGSIRLAWSLSTTGPANNNFANATTLTGSAGTATGTNVGASKESGEPSHAQFGGKSVWWKWTPASSGSVTIETTGSGFDTLLAVYTGSAVNALTSVASNDDAGGGVRQSLVTFSAIAGTTYRIAVDGYNGSSPITAQDPALAAEGSVALAWNQMASAGALSVTASADIVSLGSVGSAFNPSAFNYSLKASEGTVNWSITGVPDWLTASATSGTVDSNGTTVTFSVNTAATTKEIGAYGPAMIAFANTDSGQGNTTRTAGLTVSSIACEAMAKGPEFNGDGKGDILWRSNDGGIGLWFMNGAALSGGPGLGAVPLDWRIVAAADFNGDGKSDLLWRNISTGETAVWFISGVTVTGTAGIATVPTGWKLLGAGDFNGDGKADLLWRQDDGAIGVWLLNNGAVQSTAGLGGVSTSWRIVGLGDFNGDGKTDLLWRAGDGTVAVWLMNGAAAQTTGSLGAIPADWRIAGVGDFNGDAKADILWRNDNSTYAMWFMNGTGLASSGAVGTISSDWHLVSTNDYNGDGKADLLWRQDNGTLGIWLMNGAAMTSAGGIGGVAHDWHIVNGEHDRPPVLIAPGPC